MNIKYGNGITKHGPGVSIDLTGDEVAIAISAYLEANGIHIRGPRTITVNGKRCEAGHIYVDPSGFVVSNGQKFSGRGALTNHSSRQQRTLPLNFTLRRSAFGVCKGGNRMAKWTIGDIAAIQRPHEPVAGVVIIESIAQEPKYESEKYFGVRAITCLVDWSAFRNEFSLASVARKPGEVWNAHFAELHDIV